jgi:hypothetical protein
MNHDHVDPPSFAEYLMKSEPGSDELRRRYEEGKLALLERRLSPWQLRIGWLGVPLNVLLIIGCGYRILMANPPEQREWVVLDAVCAVGLLALCLWVLRVLLRGGRVTWQDDRAMEWVGGLSLCAFSFALFEIAQSMEDTHAARRLEAFSIVLLVGGAFAGLLERIRRSKLETRVKLLELELRVSELARAVNAPIRGSRAENSPGLDG